MIHEAAGTYAAAIPRAALIGNLKTLHSADRFASRGRTRSVSQKYMLAVLTPTSSATSATERSAHGLRDRSSADREDKEGHAGDRNGANGSGRSARTGSIDQ